MAVIDLSLCIDTNTVEPIPVRVERVSHAAGADILGKPIGIGHESFPDGMGLSLETVTLTTHTGTHVDAPIHYGPLCEGRPARTIGELPLDWFYADGVLIDCDDDPERGAITVAEIAGALDRAAYALKPRDIVLIKTNGDRLYGTPEYFTRFRGVSLESTRWLLDQGIKIIGVDTFGFDPPFNTMLKKYQDTRNPGALWPAHIHGRTKEYCQIERLANLSQLKRPCGFKVCCFPINVEGCGGGWSRVVAIVED
jgi:kynurenine formamidase